MSNKYHTACTFRNSSAARKMAASYRKQFGIGLDGKPRRYGKKKTRIRTDICRCMKWTTDKPTEPGWYWIKNFKGSIHISRVGNGWVWDDGYGKTARLNGIDGFQWAGPIPEPEK